VADKTGNEYDKSGAGGKKLNNGRLTVIAGPPSRILDDLSQLSAAQPDLTITELWKKLTALEIKVGRKSNDQDREFRGPSSI
jgi:hypothetical protein